MPKVAYYLHLYVNRWEQVIFFKTGRQISDPSLPTFGFRVRSQKLLEMFCKYTEIPGKQSGLHSAPLLSSREQSSGKRRAHLMLVES